ncbi:MAG: NAD(P)H-hydrate dehydratase [Burkholderiales bacterium]|nr:NAD(P)H-hydrate dehydratase [Burkholderiales bacterium]
MSEPLPIYPTAGIRALEAALPAARPSLMERAGLAAAELARALAEDGRPILVFAGPGNNGGDALVAARHLKAWFYRVDVVCAADPTRLPADAAAAFAAWRAAGGGCLSEPPRGGDWGLVIDGLFGIGLTRPLGEPYGTWVAQINEQAAPILALDIPSGLDADSGLALGPTVRARHTVTFLALKPGLLTADGPDHCGTLHLRTLDVPASLFPPPPGRLLETAMVRAFVRPRPRNSHKGRFGTVAVLGGAPGMTGAALLASRAALAAGAGRVYAGLLHEAALTVDCLQPELMLRSPATLPGLEPVNVIAAGPGLGTSAAAVEYLRAVIGRTVPLVLDADALNLIAADPALKEAVSRRSAPTLMTPHPAEAARLLGTSVEQVQRQRVETASRLATRFNAWVALKGAGTVCAGPTDSWFINTSGNPGLASAGTGDVLTGIVAALLAQGLGPQEALLAGVHVHGLAADRLVEQGIGPIGLTASELIGAVRRLLNEWAYGLSRPADGVA